MATRLRETATATASALGVAVFSFQAPPPMVVLTGSLGIPAAPSSAVATVVVGGITWGTWGGNATFGPVQQFAAEQCVITVSGLTAGTAYTAVFIGMAENEQSSEVIWPSAIATAINTTSVSVPSFHGAKIAATANTVINTGTDVAVGLAGTVMDSDGFAGVTPNALVVPAALAGTYLIEWHVDWVNGTPIGGSVYFYFTVSGAINRSADANLPPALIVASTRQSWGGSTLVPLAAGSSILLRCVNNTGVNLTCEGAADDTGFRSSLGVALVGV